MAVIFATSGFDHSDGQMRSVACPSLSLAALKIRNILDAKSLTAVEKRVNPSDRKISDG